MQTVSVDSNGIIYTTYTPVNRETTIREILAKGKPYRHEFALATYAYRVSAGLPPLRFKPSQVSPQEGGIDNGTLILRYSSTEGSIHNRYAPYPQ